MSHSNKLGCMPSAAGAPKGLAGVPLHTQRQALVAPSSTNAGRDSQSVWQKPVNGSANVPAGHVGVHAPFRVSARVPGGQIATQAAVEVSGAPGGRNVTALQTSSQAPVVEFPSSPRLSAPSASQAEKQTSDAFAVASGLLAGLQRRVGVGQSQLFRFAGQSGRPLTHEPPP